jgi:hypothetical protein
MKRVTPALASLIRKALSLVVRKSSTENRGWLEYAGIDVEGLLLEPLEAVEGSLEPNLARVETFPSNR